MVAGGRPACGGRRREDIFGCRQRRKRHEGVVAGHEKGHTRPINAARQLLQREGSRAPPSAPGCSPKLATNVRHPKMTGWHVASACRRSIGLAAAYVIYVAQAFSEPNLFNLCEQRSTLVLNTEFGLEG